MQSPRLFDRVAGLPHFTDATVAWNMFPPLAEMFSLGSVTEGSAPRHCQAEPHYGSMSTQS